MTTHPMSPDPESGIVECECGTWLENGRDANGTKHKCPLPPRGERTEILILTDDFLPLSVREAAKRAAVAVVESWRACKTYDEWSARDRA